jgi:dTMP kinase
VNLTTARSTFSSPQTAGSERAFLLVNVNVSPPLTALMYIFVLRAAILEDLEAGTTVVCDRYAFSGIAFTAVKVRSLCLLLCTPSHPPFLDQGISRTWCQFPDIGLPLPDMVLFLELSPAAAALREGFGGERYETSAVQIAVRDVFDKIGKDVGEGVWKILDAGRDVDQVEKDVRRRVDDLLERVGGEVGKLWEEMER